MRVLWLGLVAAAASAAAAQSPPPLEAGASPGIRVVLFESEGAANAAFAQALAAASRSGAPRVAVAATEGYTPSMDDVLRPAIWLGTRMVVVGVACGVVYAVGGLIHDALTTGLNRGTALAFGALVGMPVLFGAAGFTAGGVGGAVVMGVRVVIGR